MGAIKFYGGLLMVALFSFALVIFAADFAGDNGASVNIVNDEAIYGEIGVVNSSLEQFRQDANGSIVTFGESSIEAGSETTTTGGTFKVWPSEAIEATESSFAAGFESVFGGDVRFGVFFSTLVAFLGVLLFLYGWSIWKGGFVN